MKSHRDVSIWKTVSGLVFSFLLLTPSSLQGVAGKFCSGSQIAGQQSQHRALEGKNAAGEALSGPHFRERKGEGGGLAWGLVLSAQHSQA